MFTSGWSDREARKLSGARGAKRQISARSANARATPGWPAGISIKTKMITLCTTCIRLKSLLRTASYFTHTGITSMCSLDQQKVFSSSAPDQWRAGMLGSWLFRSSSFRSSLFSQVATHPWFMVCLSTSSLSRGLFRAGQASAAEGIFAAYTGSLKKTGSFD